MAKLKWKTGMLENYDGPLIYGTQDTSKYLLINVLYKRPGKENKWSDTVYFVVKNVETGEKKLMTLKNPPYLFYTVKEGFRDYTYMPACKPLIECEPHVVKKVDLIKQIAEAGGPKLKEMYTNLSRNNFKALKNLHKWPYVLGSDIEYQSFARIQWLLHYHNPNIDTSISKIYLDIEVDTIDVPGFPYPGQCPINAVTVTDEEGGTVYTFLLRNPKNPLIKEFEDNVNETIKKCHELFDETYGKMEYRIFMYDKEIELIGSVFALINILKRDFCLIWNMSFDIPYIIARIKELGYVPADIMCSKDFSERWVYYQKDTFAHDFKKKNDKFTIASYTVFMCQMTNYIKIRKGKSELKSLQLNAIGWKELKDTKIDYSEDANIKTLPYVDFIKFVIYNMKDTLLQMGIERKTHDTDNAFLLSLTNATPYTNEFSQTILLRNYAYISYFSQGYILGNNRNRDYSGEMKLPDEVDDDDTYEGGLVGDPMLNDYVGAINFGKPSKFIFKDVIDMDSIRVVA